MHTTNLRKVGGSIMLAVPPAILDMLHLEAGATVGLAVDEGRLVVQPQTKPKYTLDELLALCETEAQVTEEDASARRPTGGGGNCETRRTFISSHSTQLKAMNSREPALSWLSPPTNSHLHPCSHCRSNHLWRSLSPGTRLHPVSLAEAGTRTTGVVRCDQPRPLDLAARNARRLEAVPQAILEDVLAKLVTLFV